VRGPLQLAFDRVALPLQEPPARAELEKQAAAKGGIQPWIAKEMLAILKTGAPLSFAGMELRSVNHALIDPRRFELPAQPETLDQIRERMKPLPPPPTATPTKP